MIEFFRRVLSSKAYVKPMKSYTFLTESPATGKLDFDHDEILKALQTLSPNARGTCWFRVTSDINSCDNIFY